ncbi:MAG TPA: TetR/AcrR family transcriptional regulator [Rhodococcus sp. (in: high G+C Gram-positive bacteria)]|uniref:TetR/AcrR family transcriptional regulator n=1 Tax=Rhodococcus sp. SJ-3 TaxID=3454628 RepID=UPI002DA6D32D|nr:TetR/AcrR family transcriptional regulator [Rhodococcus sp. (in: high G+C Gram-positive bacteria)]
MTPVRNDTFSDAPSRHPLSPDSDPPGDSIENKILDAARSCLLDFGLRRTTLAEIARRAGVSRPTVYRRWPDTDSVLADLLTREIRAALPDTHGVGPTRPLLVSAVVTAAHDIGTHPIFEKILRTDPEVLITYIVDRLGTSQRAILDVLVSAITQGQSDGSVRGGDPHTLAAFVLLTAQSTVQSVRMISEFVDHRALLDELGHAIDSYLAPAERSS